MLPDIDNGTLVLLAIAAGFVLLFVAFVLNRTTNETAEAAQSPLHDYHHEVPFE